MKTPMIVALRKEMYGKKGFILINAALIAEKNLEYLSNNNIIVVTADEISQIQRKIY
jgi:dephospho-CoA kinase